MMWKYIDIVRTQKRPIRFLISRLIRVTGIWRFLVIRRTGYNLRFHPASIPLSLWVEGKTRDADCEGIRKLLSVGDTYVDIGANVGQLAIEASLAVGDTGRVFAFEAHPRIAQYLRENVRINKLQNLFVAQVAVGNEFGWVGFSDQRSDDLNQVSADGIQVPMIKLGPYFSDIKIKLLKIDVEGYEKYCLEGFGAALDNVDYIYLEAYDAHFRNAGYGFPDVFDLLVGHQFQVVSLVDGIICEIGREDSFPACVNIFAVRNMVEFQRKMVAS